MGYRQMMLFREALAARGMGRGLEAHRELCCRLGDPQNATEWVHITGTNGKGSVGAFLEAILLEAGIKPGRYFSPALEHPLECIRAGGRAISKISYGRHMEAIKRAVEDMERVGSPLPSLFEAETALAYLYMGHRRCGLGLLEVGMGGLEDATNNIPPPLVSVFCPIDLDHGAYLGRDLALVAGHKAGILKSGSLAVSAAQPREAWEVLEAQSARLGVVLRRAGEPEAISWDGRRQRFSYGHLHDLEISLAGKHQTANAALAIEAAWALAEKGYAISQEDIRRGLAAAQWPCRMEILHGRPLVLLDGAHNAHGALALAESLEAYYPAMRKIFVLGMLADKDGQSMLEAMAPLAQHILTITVPDNARAMTALDLAELAGRFHSRVSAAASLEEAWEFGRLLAGEDGMVVAWGSLAFLQRFRAVALGYGHGQKKRRAKR